jgi:broad specificity phosphatase PhoE
VRHARPVVDRARDPSAWELTAEGEDAAADLGRALRPRRVTTVASSPERKAIETANAVVRGLAEPHDVDVVDGLREVERPWVDGPLDDAVRAYLDGVVLAGWEPQQAAVARFDLAVRRLDGAALVVTHGTVLALWLASTVDDLASAELWTSMRMPDAYAVDLTARSLRRLV